MPRYDSLEEIRRLTEQAQSLRRLMGIQSTGEQIEVIRDRIMRAYVPVMRAEISAPNQTIGEENEMPEDDYVYARCGERDCQRQNSTVLSVRRGSGYGRRCEEHRGTCYNCDRGWAQTHLYMLPNSYGDMRLFCPACTSMCGACGERFLAGTGRHLPDLGIRCLDCVQLCECDRDYFSPTETPSCYTCRTERRDIEGYHHTRPMMWLGGPVKRKGGYYLGFELEISADEYASGTPVKEWAQENLGDRNAMSCKEDSSVSGFEIVTQPMTPDFFESVNWEDFFDMLNDNYPLTGTHEPSSHGLHVHIGRRAFEFNDLQQAAFAYLIAQGDHLERIGRREPTSYCNKVEKPVSEVVFRAKGHTRQGNRIYQSGRLRMGRDAINLHNDNTIEIRAFRSTRSADELRNAVRLVYVAAEYVRFLTHGKKNINPRALHWSEFSRWVAVEYPDAFASIAGVESKPPVRQERKPKVITARSSVNTREEEVETMVVAQGSLSRINAEPVASRDDWEDALLEPAPSVF